jgi:hypothetical protein
VEQEDRRAAPGHDAVDLHVGGDVDELFLETLEHAAEP